MKQCVPRQSLLRGSVNLSRCLVVAVVAIVTWVERARGISTCTLLDQQLGFTAEQYQICLGQGGTELLQAVGVASSQDFPEECNYWMSDERWNCSGITMPVFAQSFQSPTHWVHKLTKETAYVQALTSGLLLHRVVKDCSDGNIPGCSCVSLSDSLPSGEEWQSCNDNVDYGVRFINKFVDTLWGKDQHEVQEKRGDYQPSVSEQMVHLHNLEAGRQAVTQNQVKHCRCHGMTTSCQVKTCTKVMPDPRLIGQILKTQYETAQEVEVVRERESLPNELVKVDHTPSTYHLRYPDDTQLVYQEESPDYCNANSSYGSTGVSGRECVLEIDPYTGPSRLGLCKEVCCSAFSPQIVNVERVCNCILEPGKVPECNQKCLYEEVRYYCS